VKRGQLRDGWWAIQDLNLFKGSLYLHLVLVQATVVTELKTTKISLSEPEFPKT
jgi:hypothetical protein